MSKRVVENIGNLIQGVYINSRQRIRGFIIKRKFLDRYFGNILVNMDLVIRKTGILTKELQKGHVQHNGFNIYFGKEDSGLVEFILTNNDYETETRMAIEGILKPGDVFVDLGANIGFFTLLAARLVGHEGKVFAFEPTPRTKEFLVKNVKENDFSDRVVIENFAISDRRDKVMFNITALSECNSISTGEVGQYDIIEVDTISIDEYFLEKNLKRINCIKMDIEGQELQAIRGMEKINSRYQGIKIIFEYHKENIKKHNLQSIEFFNLLQSYGYNQFTVLFRVPFKINIPDDLNLIEREASRANLNILAEKI